MLWSYVAFADGKELFYVLPEVIASCTSDLLAWKEVLTSAERLIPCLNRNPQVMCYLYIIILVLYHWQKQLFHA